jgi:hypothetical protein
VDAADKSVRLEHEQPKRLGQHRGQPSRVTNLAPGDDQSHVVNLKRSPDGANDGHRGVRGGGVVT